MYPARPGLLIGFHGCDQWVRYKIVRKLDCAVIENIHSLRRKENGRPFDSARGVFIEGEALYPTAGFYEKSHIQLCIRNPNCIKGFFIPREEDPKWLVP